MMFEKAILHLDLDTFFVSVERLKNSDFVGKPLLIGGTSQRGVVASCSYEARTFGVHSAMPMKMALRLCPQATVISGDMDSYSYYSKMVTSVIAEDAPMYEKASIDEFYLDLTGMDKYFGTYTWSKELRHRIITETGLPISFGLSVNKLVSKVGTGEGKPNGELMVPRGEEKNFLAPLSTRKIPGVGKEMYKKLSFMGVRNIKILSEIPMQLLEREFGKTGRNLWKKANAIDNTPVIPYREKKSISKERTFMEDSLDLKMIKGKLVKMSDQLAFELRTKKQLTSVVTVKIRYADFNTHVKQVKISYTNQDNALKAIILPLFDKLYQRRQLIRLIGVKFSSLVYGNYQLSLFDDTERDINLSLEMDKIRQRFGPNIIGRASYL